MTTMKLGGNASYVADVTTQDELRQVYLNAKKINQPVYVIGGGSNLIVQDEGFDGVVAHMLIPGIAQLEEDKDTATIQAGAGVEWDELVRFTVARNLTGIEGMSGIPGTAGAAPVQNIGAYGQELADTLVSLEAYDIGSDAFVTLSASDCDFSYRHSIFRGGAEGKYVIVSITLKLYKSTPQPPFYDSLQRYFDKNGASTFTAESVRTGVLAIRAEKLPDPKILPSAGSFFKNPVIENWQAEEILKNYVDMPTYPMDDKHVKVPAGWLIEQCDLKGQLINGIRVYEGNAVVLVNESANSYEDLLSAKDEITNSVRDVFRIPLVQEPLVLYTQHSK